MKDKVVLITGSTDGIGKEAASKLIEMGDYMIIHGRNQKKAELIMKEIEKKTNLHNMSTVYADLASIDQIATMVDDIYKKFDRLDVLINNAGIYRPQRQLSHDGFEETFAVNYVAPYILTNRLINLLKKANLSRIVNVVSEVQSNQLDFNNLQFETGYTGVKAYARSKTCLVMFTYLLAEKLKRENITANCLHPGIINTKVLEAAMGMVGAPVSVGADTLVHAATSPKLEGITGKFLDMKRIQPSKDITYNKELQEKLWQITEKLIGMDFKDF